MSVDKLSQMRALHTRLNKLRSMGFFRNQWTGGELKSLGILLTKPTVRLERTATAGGRLAQGSNGRSL